MMREGDDTIMMAAASTYNGITILLMLIVIGSMIIGISRGATNSAKHLILMLGEGAITIISLFLTWNIVLMLSPSVQSWLTQRGVSIPVGEINAFKQMYYTLITSLRDFPMFRFGILFIIIYVILKQVIYRLTDPLLTGLAVSRMRSRDSTGVRPSSAIWNIGAGGAIGLAAGATRAIMLILAMFIFVSLFPSSPFTGYIKDSSLYSQGANDIIAPLTGHFISDKVPVITKAVEKEFSGILQRKYEVIDANVPNNIAEAAKTVTAKGTTDEERAKLLYQWVGTRIQYDWNKVSLYEEKRIWKEQTPADTFRTKEGVCIDYARLYAVMARSVGLDVRVVTGIGYDGQGGSGAHAWNEVYLNEKKAWIPLDSTWVASGGNWFNPPDFNKTHVREA
jgi:hypothetical protein